jgi:hypothetical protein
MLGLSVINSRLILTTREWPHSSHRHPERSVALRSTMAVQVQIRNDGLVYQLKIFRR